MSTETWINVDEMSRVGAVRRAADDLARTLGLGEQSRADLGIVATELGTNLVKHADDGVVLVRPVRDFDDAGVQLLCIDSGPGMPDVAQSLVDGESTAGTLGIGLGAVARLAHRCDVYSAPGSGTILAAEVWRHRPAPNTDRQTWTAGLTRPLTGEPISGDFFASRVSGDRYQIMVCDGLGHGPLAAAASQAAYGAFVAAPPEPPAKVVQHLNVALAHTRGAALAVAELDFAAARVTLCGLGNISASTVTGMERRGLISMPGIAGHHRSGTREFSYPFPPGAVLVMHSDGVSNRWSLEGYPGLAECSPLLIAATVLRDAGTRRDDACVLAAKAVDP